eukprot:4542388-Heterocapsa_arctica.AAC.2
MNNARTYWFHININDVRKSHSIPSVGVFLCHEHTTYPTPDAGDLQSYQHSYHMSSQGATPGGGQVIIGILENQVFVVLEFPT